MYQLFIGGPLFFVRAWVGVEMAAVPGVPWVHELGVDLEVVGPREGERGKVAWCGALSMEASSGGLSWRPEVAVRRAEEKEEEAQREGDMCEEEPGCLGWTLHL